MFFKFIFREKEKTETSVRTLKIIIKLIIAADNGYVDVGQLNLPNGPLSLKNSMREIHLKCTRHHSRAPGT